MIVEYFGFNEEPFGVTPEPRCLYPSGTHREALASLNYGFLTNRGFTALIAAPGMGKTTLLHAMLKEIQGTARSIYLFDLNVQCEPSELIAYILRDLGVVAGASSVEMHEQLNGVLLDTVREGKKLVVIIDEAQNLSDAALETVRLLSNFETSGSKLMQIVLAGQPQLGEKLMRPSLVQLRQRISTVCRLEPLSREEVRAYIDHRLKVAGYQGDPLFTSPALDSICSFSQGIPRLINNACFNALSLCRAHKLRQVDDRMMSEVIADFQLTPPKAARGVEAEDTVWVGASAADKSNQIPRRKNLRASVAAALLFGALLGGFGLSELFGYRPIKSAEMPSNDSGDQSLEAPRASAESVAAVSERSDKPLRITVLPRQTLEDITVQYLGSLTETHLRQIRALNPEITDPDHIEAGQTIWIPRSTAMSAQRAVSTANARNLQ